MLDAFFDPESVAVVGASTNPVKLGHAVLKNLVDGGYSQRGKVYPINPKADQILKSCIFPIFVNLQHFPAYNNVY